MYCKNLLHAFLLFKHWPIVRSVNISVTDSEVTEHFLHVVQKLFATNLPFFENWRAPDRSSQYVHQQLNLTFQFIFFTLCFALIIL